MIDACLGAVALRAPILTLFARDPLVLLTHAHLDHVGGAARAADQRLCTVVNRANVA